MQELKLAPRPQSALEDFVRKLELVFKNELISVILYGSAASGEFVDRHSNLNLLIVIAYIRIENIKKAARLINKFKFRAIDPLFLSEDYIKSSCDVFPIEFLDMTENYAVLFGKDVLKDIHIDLRNLRFQCEKELKAKLITLRQSYLRFADNRSAVKYLLFRYFTSVTHILRNVIRLKGKKPPYRKSDILHQIAQDCQIEVDAFKKVLAVKNKEIKLGGSEIEPLFVKFTSELEKIVNIVDKI